MYTRSMFQFIRLYIVLRQLQKQKTCTAELYIRILNEMLVARSINLMDHGDNGEHQSA
jgi:hypothetical protein